MPGVRVAPADREHLVALADQVLGHAAAGREVGDVELVDHRRHDEHRVLVDLLGGRGVLDQLEHLGTEDHRARRDGQVAADLEGTRLDHGRHPWRFGQVREQGAKAAERAEPARVDQRLDGGRVQQRVVAGRGGRDEVRQHEPQPLVVAPVQLGASHQPGRRLSGCQIGLEDTLEHGILAPGRVGEPAILALRCQLGRAGHDLGQLPGQRGGMLAHDPRPLGQVRRKPQNGSIRAESPQHAEGAVGEQHVERTG